MRDARPAQVAVELAARDEVGEGELLEDRRAGVGEVLLEGDGVDEPGGTTSQPRRSAGASVLLAVPA